MVFDWREYLNLARFLSGNAEMNFAPEAAFRSAMSRAYYAAFCHARNYARYHQGFVPTHTAKDHTRVREYFQKLEMNEIATRLDSLRKWRNNSDYDDTVSNISIMLSSAIKEAEKVVNGLA